MCRYVDISRMCRYVDKSRMCRYADMSRLTRPAPALVSVQIWAYPGMQPSPVSQIDTSWGTRILSRPGGDSCCRKRKTETGCVQLSKRVQGVSPWVEVAPTDNMVISRSEFWSCQQAMEMSHQGGHIVYLLCVWIIEDMHTYPKLNSVAVLGRTKNAYWQSQFLCSSSSLHNTPGSQQNTEQVDTSKLLRTQDLLCC